MNEKPHSITQQEQSCPECGFSLFHPVGSFTVSRLGIYSDARFPGRSILVLNHHEENVDIMPEELYLNFCKDIRTAVALLKKATDSERINVSILGNTEPHVHAHLIPRWPEKEELPGKSPWNDPRPYEPLLAEDLNKIKKTFTELIK